TIPSGATMGSRGRDSAHGTSHSVIVGASAGWAWLAGTGNSRKTIKAARSVRIGSADGWWGGFLCRADKEVRPLALHLAEPEALELARLRARQRVHERDGAGVLVRRDLALDEVLQLLGERVVPGEAVAEDDERLDDLPARL